MKWIIIPLVLLVLFCGCTSVQPTVTETLPTPVTVTQTYIPTETPTETVGPVPTNDMGKCFDRNVATYPDYCADYYYWVKPTITPVGMGYTARVWQNSSCTYRNKTSEECEQWGDDSWTSTFMKNLTIVRNLTGINLSEVISATSYYNRSFGLNIVNGADFNSFIDVYWNGIYPETKYDTELFAPNLNINIPIINGTFNPYGF